MALAATLAGACSALGLNASDPDGTVWAGVTRAGDDMLVRVVSCLPAELTRVVLTHDDEVLWELERDDTDAPAQRMHEFRLGTVPPGMRVTQELEALPEEVLALTVRADPTDWPGDADVVWFLPSELQPDRYATSIQLEKEDSSRFSELDYSWCAPHGK